ncbi:hypothetical protein AMTR_s00025p00164120 [Amborella trichopoda]|uniref:Uncharacterized protein n=1 Tax=Amborella trichopoda TaxID=13333 RepID=W1PX18_AMBTC|nr:hypothetical protein AMTR_s00025p00164120 [Amborella trichopoda]
MSLTARAWEGGTTLAWMAAAAAWRCRPWNRTYHWIDAWLWDDLVGSRESPNKLISNGHGRCSDHRTDAPWGGGLVWAWWRVT